MGNNAVNYLYLPLKRMKTMRKICILLIISLFFANAKAQDKVVATVNGQKIMRSELVRRYKDRATTDDMKKITEKEFLTYLINEKLKVAEANNLRFDTITAVKDEYLKATEKISFPYLYDTAMFSSLAHEAYQRMQTDIESQHILIRLDSWASPADTLIAWNKLIEARNRIMSGEDFAKVAASVSNDPNTKSTGGYLGWATVFKFVYPFETALYQTPKGTVSMPFRTQFGYHIVRVINTRPSRGEVNVAHLALRVPDESLNDTIYARANQLYIDLKNGYNLKKAFRERTDNGKNPLASITTGWIGTNQLGGTFDSVAFSISEKGQYAAPFRSRYGWHILMLADKRPVGTYAERLKDISDLIQKNERGMFPRKKILNRLNAEYKPVINYNTFEGFYTIPDTTLKSGNWNYWNLPQSVKFDAVLLTFAQQSFTVNDFWTFAQKYKDQVTTKPAKPAMDYLLNSWVDEKIFEYEKSQLSAKYPKYANDCYDAKNMVYATMYNQLHIYKPAETDSVGLNAFYQTNKTKYMWDKRLEAFLVSGADSLLMTEVFKKVKDISATGDSLKGIEAMIRKDYPTISIEKMLLDPTSIPSAENSVALSDLTSYPGMQAFSYTTGLVPPMPKLLSEVYALQLADYKQYLEKKNTELLRSKAKIQTF
jgi:peptidyl-prolyl cis-trans isomerase SurA